MMSADPPTVPLSSTTIDNNKSSHSKKSKKRSPRRNSNENPTYEHHHRRRKRQRDHRQVRPENDDKWPKITTLIAASMALFALCNVLSSNTNDVRVFEYTKQLRGESSDSTTSSRQMKISYKPRAKVMKPADESSEKPRHIIPKDSIALSPKVSLADFKTSKTGKTTSSSSSTTTDNGDNVVKVIKTSTSAKNSYQWISTYTKSPTPVNATATATADDGSEKNKVTEEDSDDSSPDKTADLKHFKDNWDEVTFEDRPLFWNIPHSGGEFMEDYFGSCHEKTLASKRGAALATEDGKTLSTITNKKDKMTYVTIDPTTRKGLRRAAASNYATVQPADITSTPLLHGATQLFSSSRSSGRVFALFHDPIVRAVSAYNEFDGDIRDEMTLDEYAKGKYIRDNFVTRSLLNKRDDETLSDADVSVAMDVLRRKVLVGLTSRMEESMERFEKFFDWSFDKTGVQEKCRGRLLKMELAARVNEEKTKVAPDGETYKLLLARNEYDMKLFHYVKRLFKEQDEFVKDKPDDFRLISAHKR